MFNAKCLGKTIFSKNGADSFKKGRKVSRITKKKIRTYFCPRCKNYHLTTTNDHEPEIEKYEEEDVRGEEIYLGGIGSTGPQEGTQV